MNKKTQIQADHIKRMTLRFSEIIQKKLGGADNLSKIAKELDINHKTLHQWVNGQVPSLKNIEGIARLADYLGYSLEELLIGESDNKKIISSIRFKDSGRQYRINIEREK